MIYTLKNKFKRQMVTSGFAAAFALCMMAPTVMGQTRGNLPPPQSDNDPIPTAPKFTGTQNPGITEQAGVGGNQGYARAGVLELGGSASFTKAEDLTEISFTPAVGWFIIDNLQLTGLLAWNFAKGGTGDGAHVLSAMVEPSFYYPMDDSRFIFAGLGAGIQYMDSPTSETGFAIAPRVGYKQLVGRSGLVSLDVRPVFSFNDDIEARGGNTLIGFDSLWGINAGYSILW